MKYKSDTDINPNSDSDSDSNIDIKYNIYKNISLLFTFNVINNIILHSFKLIIDEILNINFNNTFYILNNIYYNYKFATNILKNSNSLTLNNDILKSYNIICDAYNIALIIKLNLKHIRGDNIYPNYIHNISEYMLYLYNNSLSCANTYNIHLNLKLNLKDIITNNIFSYNIQNIYKNMLYSNPLICALHKLQHIDIIKDIIKSIINILQFIYPNYKTDLDWFNELNYIVNNIYQYNKNIINDYKLIQLDNNYYINN